MQPIFIGFKKQHLFSLFMLSMFSAKFAIFTKSQLIRCSSLIFCCCIISSLTFTACKGNNYSHQKTPSPNSFCFYSIISLTTPAPTVLPPSLMANLTSFSIAIGVINSAKIVTLSPGIIISIPSGRFNMPVTSVVLK